MNSIIILFIVFLIFLLIIFIAAAGFQTSASVSINSNMPDLHHIHKVSAWTSAVIWIIVGVIVLLIPVLLFFSPEILAFFYPFIAPTAETLSKAEKPPTVMYMLLAVAVIINIILGSISFVVAYNIYKSSYYNSSNPGIYHDARKGFDHALISGILCFVAVFIVIAVIVYLNVKERNAKKQAEELREELAKKQVELQELKQEKQIQTAQAIRAAQTQTTKT